MRSEGSKSSGRKRLIKESNKVTYRNGQMSSRGAGKGKKAKSRKPAVRSQAAKYDPEKHPKLAAAAAALGGNIQKIAEFVGTSVSTLYDWRKNHTEFAEALKKGKNDLRADLEMALFKKARGFEWTETRVKTVPDPDDPKKVITLETVTIQKFTPPDTAALVFSLCNLWKEDWKQQQAVDLKHSGKIETTPDLVLDPETARQVGDLLASKIQPPLEADSVVPKDGS